MPEVKCLIKQSACGRIAAEPICPKCGLDERMRYIGEEAALLAKSQAQARYSKAEEFQAQLRKTPELPQAPPACPSQKYQNGEVFQDLPEAPQMVVLPRGSFLMGTANDVRGGGSNERPQHRVELNYKLALGRYPVTFEEWDACVADGGTDYMPTDEGWGRGKRPVVNVIWDDAQAYITWLNKKLGFDAKDPTRYRLPSEAEWEYACRASTTGDYSTKNGKLSKDSATHRSEQHKKTTPVGNYPPNLWGLYDMHGNVWEWVQDSYKDSYRGAPRDGSAWETGHVSRVLRGGSWFELDYFSRAAIRNKYDAGYRYFNVGFRVARTTQ